jgi:hypothetical protein
MRAWSIAALALAGGCSWFGAMPVRFESPAQSGARILNDDQMQAEIRDRRARVGPTRATTTPSRGSDDVIDPYADREPLAPLASSTITPIVPPSGVVISRLPDARAPSIAAPSIIPRTADALRALVGVRRGDDPLAFALAAASSITERPAPAIAIAPGPVTAPDRASPGETLVGWLDARAAGIDPTIVRAGDLLVFDRAVGDRPASLVAVALSRDDRGVIEMIYLAAGVVRRGFVDPARPSIARDRTTRRTHNTYLRHGRDWPPAGTRFLAGQLLRSAYRLP